MTTLDTIRGMCDFATETLMRVLDARFRLSGSIRMPVTESAVKARGQFRIL